MKADSKDLRQKRLKELMREIKREINNVAKKRGILATVTRVYIDKVINILLQRDEGNVREILFWAYNGLLPIANNRWHQKDFYEALCVFDLGIFAYSLFYYFDDVEKMARQIWDLRKDLMPHLGDTIAVAYRFANYLRRGKRPGRAFRYALKDSNYMYSLFHDSTIYGNKPIGHVISSSALTKLKEILREHVREHGKGSCG